MAQEKAPGMPLWQAARAMGIAVVEEVEPVDRWVHVNGIRLHYLDWGTADKHPVVLLHGGMQTAHSWDFVALALRSDYRVLALDQRGHGDSEWSPDRDYSRTAQLRDLEQFVEKLRLDSPILIGLSMGGHNAAGYAAHHSDRMKALVLVDVAPSTRKEGQQNIQRFTADFPEQMDSYEEFVQRVHAFNPRRSIEQLRGSLWHNVRRLPNGKWSWKYDKTIRDPSQRARGWDADRLWEMWKSIRCPTLLVWGAQSDIVDREIMERVKEAIPSSRLASVSGAGHLVSGDNPAGFVRSVREFLAALA